MSTFAGVRLALSNVKTLPPTEKSLSIVADVAGIVPFVGNKR
jgi:hypothetical protein